MSTEPKYRLSVKNDFVDPDRITYHDFDTWEEAADSAVNSGFAHWDKSVLILHDDAEIRAVREDQS